MNRLILSVGLGLLVSLGVQANDLTYKAPTVYIKAKNQSDIDALTIKADIEQRVMSLWEPPLGSSGQRAYAVLKLDETGEIQDLKVSSTNHEMKQGIEKLINQIAPIKLPQNLSNNEQNRVFKLNFVSR